MRYRTHIASAALVAASLLAACSSGENEPVVQPATSRPETRLPDNLEACVNIERINNLGAPTVFFAKKNDANVQDIYIATNLGPNPTIEIPPYDAQTVESINTVQVDHGLGVANENKGGADFTESQFFHDYKGGTFSESDGGRADFNISELPDGSVKILATLCNPPQEI